VRVLITNDDGIGSPGIHALVAALAGAGHDVVVAAPIDDRSGSGAAIGRIDPDEQVHARRAELPGCDGIPAFAIEGTPGLAVMAASFGAFGGDFDAVCAGINGGLNTGHLVLHSGTVGAVLTAQNFGLSGLAVSLEASDAWQWESAGAIAVEVFGWLADAERGTALNLNVPALERDDVLGIEWATLDRLGIVQTATVGEGGALQFTVAGRTEDPVPGSDTDLVGRGFAAVTALTGVTEADVAGVR
jgi:5'-nucleotidase